MPRLVLSVMLAMTALPAFAGGITMDMPNLTWPEDSQVTGSTKGCGPATAGVATPCK